jgi:hypothetical protein
MVLFTALLPVVVTFCTSMLLANATLQKETSKERRIDFFMMGIEFSAKANNFINQTNFLKSILCTESLCGLLNHLAAYPGTPGKGYWGNAT